MPERAFGYGCFLAQSSHMQRQPESRTIAMRHGAENNSMDTLTGQTPAQRRASDVASGALVRRIGLWQVGKWHEPKRDDPRFDGHEQAFAAAQSKSLKDDTALFCVWEWDDGARHATERFLFINGQAWQPA